MAGTVRLASVTRSTSVMRLRESLESLLAKWMILRSITMKFDKTPLFVALRASTKWSDTVITEAPELETPDDLCGFTLPEVHKKTVLPRNGGPLARFVIANIKSTQTAGLVVLIHHVLVDALSLASLREDLEQLLGGTEIEPPTSYKLFADMFYQHQQSLPAQVGVEFYATRFRGVGSLQDAVWPPQRCPGWLIGDDAGWQPPPGYKHSGRKQIDNDGGRAGLAGIQHHTRVEYLANLVQTHHISEPIVFKAACALVNMRHTGQSEAFFMNTQAGRQWPFMNPAVAEYLPNPVTIAGNTMALVPNRVKVDQDQTVGDLLRQMEQEQRLLTEHAHAPVASIKSQLDSDDLRIFEQVQRQVVNWSPNTRGMVAREAEAELPVVNAEMYIDVIVNWHCAMLDEKTARVMVQWDGCQVGQEEVDSWAREFIVALEWLADPAHWDSTIKESPLNTSGAI
ncbi:uncharacterized protein KY384_007204 [Bacidia gigantensis]|uniref:uncharacterized protein n=1 Tax=Bacidia gigantensis TaxID=2732470 RepID=UPI001D038C87|nr:uncharacterized protein KY384_007204 [Bacidia gigantensis]KAG8528287.1 hypothetical protein KY384_007204 [Bacidia gigantensis]